MLPLRRAALPLALLLSLVSLSVSAQEDDQGPGGHKATNLPTVNVHGEDWRKYLKAKLQYQMPEVDGPKITVTKKTTVTHLENQPTVIGNNLNQTLARTPGVLVSEQPTPTQFNLSYRGIGNPQEAEYVLVMQDGIPMEGDWIGFPTLYAFPLTQSLSQVQLIRGGSPPVSASAC
jgi:Fe(3+) dicitrate transport protein